MRWFLLLLLTSMVFAQGTHTTPTKTAKPPASVDQEDDDDEKPATTPATNVAPDAPVITIKGLCDDKPHAASVASPGKPSKATTPAAKEPCETVITRAQFEKLADSLQPNMAPQVKRQLASSYPRILTMAHEARKRGLDKSQSYVDKMQFARDQLLMQELNRTIQTEAAKVPDKDIENYYNSNPSAYEEANLLRLYVPKSKSMEPLKDAKPEEIKAQQDAAEAVMKKEADDLRARAVAGEDFDKLQKEAFDVGAVNSPPTATNLQGMRATNIPPGHVSVFSLKPGEVSPVISDASGNYVYKLVSEKQVSLDQVKEEIRVTLQSQKIRAELQKIQNSTSLDLNNAYFGAPQIPPGRGLMKPSTPGNKESSNPPAKPQ